MSYASLQRYDETEQKGAMLHESAVRESQYSA